MDNTDHSTTSTSTNKKCFESLGISSLKRKSKTKKTNKTTNKKTSSILKNIFDYLF